MEATVAAGLPQHRVSYTFTSLTDPEFCSVQFKQVLREGARTRETTFDFDQEIHIVRRTRDGTTSENLIPPCARDPLALLYYFRQQLASGQVAVGGSGIAGEFHLGSDYSVRYNPIAAETEMPGSKRGTENGFHFTVRGSEEHSFEVWLRLDDARTPVAIRVPFSLATFSAVLQ
jgi:hypothetical protein